MPEFLSDPVSRLLSIHHRSRSRIVIALAGYPGSGKTTVTRAWAAAVNSEAGPGTLTVLGMDGFHLTRAELARMDDPDEALARRGAPYTFDPEGLVSKISDLRNSAGRESVGWPGFEHEVKDPVEDAIIVKPEAPLIIVEGIYTLMRRDAWARLSGLFDEEWFLDVPLETAMDRLTIRHQKAWGLTPKEARNRADGNDRLNCAFITPGKEQADFLVGD